MVSVENDIDWFTELRWESIFLEIQLHNVLVRLMLKMIF